MKRFFLCLGLVALGLGCGGDAAKPVSTAPPGNSGSGANGIAATPSTTSENGAPLNGAGDSANGGGDTVAGTSPPALLPPPEPEGKAGADGESEEVTKRLDDAEEALLNDMPEDALKSVEASLKADGVTRRGLLLKARILGAQGDARLPSEPKQAVALYEQSVATYQQVDKKFSDLERFEQRMWAAACYDLACGQALAGDPQKSFISLKEAYRRGFKELDQIVQDDRIESVHTLPEFATFLEEKREEARDRIRTAFAEFRPIDVSFEATTLDGKKFATDEFKGKVLIVDCWATWCPPCRKMLPVLSEMHQRFHEKGLEIVGLNFENGEEAEAKTAIAEFLEKTPLAYPCVVNGVEVQPKLPFFAGIPTCFFVDRFGKIRYRTTGARSLAEVETIVQLLLEAKEVPSVSEQ